MKKLLKRKTVATMVDVSPRTLMRWADKGRLPKAIYIDRTVYFPAQETLEAIDKLAGIESPTATLELEIDHE